MTATRPSEAELERRLHSAVRRVAAAEKAKAERDEAIRAALAAGISRARIIAITGLSPARIEQIRRNTR